jgi:hypothetical protein
MDIEFKQMRVLIGKILLFLNIISLYIEAFVPSFHKPLKTSSLNSLGCCQNQAVTSLSTASSSGKCSAER